MYSILFYKCAANGFNIVATGGTCKALKDAGVECEFVYKISEGRPNVEDKLKNGEIALVGDNSGLDMRVAELLQELGNSFVRERVVKAMHLVVRGEGIVELLKCRGIGDGWRGEGQ